MLPTNTKIVAINHAHNPMCPRCWADGESLIHAFKDYVKAKEVLLHGGIDGRLLNSEWTMRVDWLESSMRLLDQKAFECLVMLLWNIWNVRNNLIFKGIVEDSKMV